MIEVEIEAAGWTVALTNAESLATIAAEQALAAAAKTGDLAILLAEDETVRDLNARFRDADRPTNVLSFPTPADTPFGDGGRRPLGDIVLALETCVREAAEQRKLLSEHLQHLVAHGVLHLVGYDHQTDGEAEAMEALERRILADLGVPDPYAARETGDHG
jgi:probable rRNA maturation factor